MHLTAIIYRPDINYSQSNIIGGGEIVIRSERPRNANPAAGVMDGPKD